ncbi:MAG: hypothetical protein K2K46_04330 [Lachnospiraceae bacterium]|nr:hypothetical protein [Lachnospiraceae bacterium]
MKRKWKQMSRIISVLLAATMIVTSMPQSMLTVNAADMTGSAVSNETISENETPESGDSNESKAEYEASGDDSPEDLISDEGKTDNGTSDEGNLDNETPDNNKPDGDISSEDDGQEDTEQVDAEQGDNEESQDSEEDDSVDFDNGEKLDSEEAPLDDENEQKQMEIRLWIDPNYITVYDENGEEITQDEFTGFTVFTVPYGSSDIIKFSIVTKTGYTLKIDDGKLRWEGIEFSKTEIKEGYECTISPIDENTGYTQSVDIYINAEKNQRYKLTFVYSSEDVDELVLTNSLEGPAQNVDANVPVWVTNEYGTSFKLKAKNGKSLAVSYKSDDGEYNDVFDSYYVEENGYYNFDLGKVSENATITIQEGWRINFNYENNKVGELHRETLVGDEADLTMGDAWFALCNMINHTEVVAKGEVLYFSVYGNNKFDLCDPVVTDASGNSIETVRDGNGEDSEKNFVYKVIPTSDMTINIDFSPITLPVAYVDGVVKNISITAEGDAGKSYDDGKKEITNIYSSMTPYNISFKIEADKHFERAEIACCSKWYDFETGEMQYDYWYNEINVEPSGNGAYSSVDPFFIESAAYELRIIAGDVCTLTFEPSDEVMLCNVDMWGNVEIGDEIYPDTPYTVVKGDEYRFGILYDVKDELAAPYVIAKAGGEMQELKTKEIERRDIGGGIELYIYKCSVIPTAGTTVSVSLKPKSIPLKYDKSALKSIGISGQSGAKLSEDGDFLYINKYEEFDQCEITFELEEGKTITGAYYTYTVCLSNEDNGGTNKTSTYTEFIPVGCDDEAAQLYRLHLFLPEINNEGVVSVDIDYIQIVAGDKCKISFEGYEGKASVYDLYSYDSNLDGQYAEAVINGEFIFFVDLYKEYNAASCHVKVGEEELPVKYYTIKVWDDSLGGMRDETIPYYSFIPTEDTKVNIEISPLTVPIKYTEDAVKSLTLVQKPGEETAAYAPQLSADGKAVIIWRYDDEEPFDLQFDLELNSGSTLSRIFCRRSLFHDDGDAIDDYIEDDIMDDNIEMVGNKYRFNVDSYELQEIEIVTDKINLKKCTIELDLDKNDNENYYAVYKTEEIEPDVTVKYEANGKTETLDPNGYTVTYWGNRNVGWGVVTVTAKKDSGYTGENYADFEIVRAAATTVEPRNISISLDINDINENPYRELNLSNSVLFNTYLGEQGVKPTNFYIEDTSSCIKCGGVLVDDPLPRVDEQDGGYNDQYIPTYILRYTVNSEADKTSEKAEIVLTASFENYEDAKVVIEISVAEKEPVILDGYALKQYKKYDSMPYTYDYDNLYVVNKDGLKHEESDRIMEELRAYIKFHYTGSEDTKYGSVPYDSYTAPVNPGNYILMVELSEENNQYTATPFYVGSFEIRRREIYIRAESVNINVGDPLPKKYTYRLTGDGLLDGDEISTEPTLSCDADNTDTAKQYRITADAAGMDICDSNGESVRYYYNINCYVGWLTISEVDKTKITLSQKDGTQLTKIYDGKAFDGISLIEAKNGETVIEDAQITVKYAGREDTDYAESEEAPVNVGTYVMTAKVDRSDEQYKSDEYTFKIDITRAASPKLKDIEIYVKSVTEDTPYTLNLAQYFSGGYEALSYGDVTMSEGADILTDIPTINAQGELAYTLKADRSDGTAELTLPIEFRNYYSADQKVKIALTSKTILTLSLNSEAEIDREYNGSTYVLPENAVNIEGMPQDAVDKPELIYTYTAGGSSESIIPLNAGNYAVTVRVSDSDDKYTAAAPLLINFEILQKVVMVTAKSGNWNKTLDSRPTLNTYLPGYELDGLAGNDEWISGPTSYTYKYISNNSEVKVEDTDAAWKTLAEGTVITVTPDGAEVSDNYDIEYVDGTLTVTDISADKQIFVKDIQPMTYTGSPLKPKVHVYTISNGELTELTSKDYKVQYSNNKDAGTGTVTITGKGNYDKTITKTFTIEKASIGKGSENKALGIALKYTDQSLKTKETKLVTSLKYKKALKEGTDFTVTLTKQDAGGNETVVSNTNGKTPAKTPKGEDKAGVYKLRIEAMDDSNYSGYIEKTVYVAGKENLIKNAKITIKTKTLKWDDKENPSYGNYDETNWKGFYLNAGSSNTEPKDFTVSIGKKYLKNSQTSVTPDSNSEYFISYSNNDQAGTATITITGDGKTYFGTKSATFKIQGNAFKAGNKTGNIELPDTVTAPEAYTGNEIIKEVGSLNIVGKTSGSESGAKQAALTENADYTVNYKNNVKKGNATIIITANPKSGYVGSIKKTFKVQAADLKMAINNGRDGIGSKNVEISFGSGEGANKITGVVYKGAVPYSKSGATISGLVFTNRDGKDLKAGTDYTVKYSYTAKNAGSGAVMTLKGKGNYSGTLNVNFTITKADYENLAVSVASAKLGTKAVKPKVTVKDGKKALTVSEDGNKEVKVKYENNEPTKVEAWLNAGAPENNAGIPAPTVTVTIEDTENYKQTQSEVITLNIYKEKMNKAKLKIKWDGGYDSPDAVYMDGLQVRPIIESIKYDNTVYNVEEINGEYFACDSSEEKAKVFKITYGANNKSGKKAGSVTIEGLRLYGGKYTEKFEISRKDISKN